MPETLKQAHYQAHLDRVSRSFAVCISRLDEPLRSWTALAYLLCRLLDTVEDATYQDSAARSALITELLGFFTTPPSPKTVLQWTTQLPAGLVAGEAALVADAQRLLDDLHALPKAPKGVMIASVSRMAQGMRHYARRWQKHEELRLTDAVDVNRYCFFVAGVVGQLLSELFALSWPGFEFSADARLNAHHFGLLLQKVNLLKDQADDERQHRFLLASRNDVIASLGTHGFAALDYITGLPTTAHAYRTFCAWSLFLGAASLPMIVGSASGATAEKLLRSETMALFRQIDTISCDNQALRNHFVQSWTACNLPARDDVRRAISKDAKESPSKNDSSDWFNALVGDALSEPSQRALGVIS